MHRTKLERYVLENTDVWRVRCARCGIVADELDTADAAEVLEAMHADPGPRYRRTGPAVLRSPVVPLVADTGAESQVPLFFDTTHILDLDTNNTACGLSNMWRYTAANPEFASCSTCLAAAGSPKPTER